MLVREESPCTNDAGSKFVQLRKRTARPCAACHRIEADEQSPGSDNSFQRLKPLSFVNKFGAPEGAP